MSLAFNPSHPFNSQVTPAVTILDHGPSHCLSKFLLCFRPRCRPAQAALVQLFWGVQVSMYCSWNFAWLTIAPSTYRGEESVAVARGAHALVKFKFQVD